jgi:neutral ceramidase
MPTRTLHALLLLCTLVILAHAAQALEAGFATADITPDPAATAVPLAGYGAREGKPATGIHDRLHAKITFLRQGTEVAAIVTTDLRSVTPELKEKILSQAATLGLSPKNILLCASHTHSGPAIFAEAFWQFQFGKHDPAIVDAMATAIANALGEAAASVAPVEVGYAECPAPGFTRNRRWEYDTAAREAAGEQPVIDPLLRVLRFDAPDGSVRGILVNFPTHPTILGAENMQISADWPGVFQRDLEKAFPGSTALYSNGAEGDQAPAGAQGGDDWARVEDFGHRLAEVAGACARGIDTQPTDVLASILQTPELPPITFSEAAQKGPYTMLAEVARQDLPRHATLQIIRVGNTALAGLPGEPIHDVGLAVRTALTDAGLEHPVVIGLANDYIGYLVTAPEYAHGGYEVDQRSYYGPGLGDFLATHMGQAAQALQASP